MKTPYAAAALAVAIATPAAANDSTAGVVAGGLVLMKSPMIEMRSEDLHISASRVRVRYRFFNTAPHDVVATVAFPLPDITPDEIGDLPAIPVDNATNFLGFTTQVDGRPVRMQVEQKAMKNGVDRTAFLRRLGVSPAVQWPATWAAIRRLPQARRDELAKLGLVDPNNEDDATWTVKTTFYWTQTFPAGREIVVEHSYAPSVGSYVGTHLTSDVSGLDPVEAKALAKERSDYCVDDAMVAAVEKTVKGAGPVSPLYETYIGYVLVTGANWKSPIGDFRMTIDKGSATNMVSFCGKDVRKTGPTTFEVHYTNFTPTRDVKVLILKRRADDPPAPSD